VTVVPAAAGERVTTTAGAVLEARGLSSGYGQVMVVRDLDIHVGPGEVVALLGPNGAGKSTTLLTLAGEIRPSGGEVHLLGEPTTAPMYRRCRDGLGFVTEERSVIMDLTTAENLRLAGVDAAEAVSLFPSLGALLGRKAGLLSGGEQQMLALARALGRHPRVLLADELSLGLAPMVVTRLLGQLRTAADTRDVGVLLVEQHVRRALDVADRVYVMQRGRIVLSGTAQEVGGQLLEIEAAYLSTSLDRGDVAPSRTNGHGRGTRDDRGRVIDG
jgi:branched-chain amino acid transport system ATP-binding protein